MRSFFAALTRHPLSLTGSAIATASAILFLVFFSLDTLGLHGHPYFGILAYLIVPALFVVGLLLIPIGVHRARRSAKAGGEFPVLDFNHPSVRNRFLVFFALTVVNVVIVAVATYKAVEVMDTTEFCGKACHSVMAPEHTAFQRGAHASVRCVDCHIGPGAGWFVKSKLSGSWQLVSVTFDLYPTPIPTPVHNLRPARDTCEQCHWPQKFVGDKLKVLTKYKEDEGNTELKTVLLLRVGGIQGRESKGIHWHVDPANRIRYRSDETREEIYEVERTNGAGEVERWLAADAKEGEKATGGVWREMDCVDCHNRPTHAFDLPERAIDRALEEGRIARDLPWVKKTAVAIMKADYPSREAAEQAIPQALADYYRKEQPQVFSARQADVAAAGAATRDAWLRNVFPAMKVTWGTHPNNIGHEDFPGCFRCHDDGHKDREGKAISQECEACHAILAMEETDPKILADLGMK